MGVGQLGPNPLPEGEGIIRRVIMAERKEITVKAAPRDGRGKNDARRARRNGQVPVTIYGGDGGAVSALVPLREFAAILRCDTGRRTIFTIGVEGAGSSGRKFL